MRNNLQLYNNLLGQLCQWLADERITRLRNLALMVTGLYLEKSVHLSFIVGAWPTAGKEPSLVNRLHRFLPNHRVLPLVYYQPFSCF